MGDGMVRVKAIVKLSLMSHAAGLVTVTPYAAGYVAADLSRPVMALFLGVSIWAISTIATSLLLPIDLDDDDSHDAIDERMTDLEDALIHVKDDLEYHEARAKNSHSGG